MNRRDFVKKAGLTAGLSLASPYIMKNGLFARGAMSSADHVVLVMFAGGVRQQESVLQRYLTDSQGLTGSIYEGNIMYNLLNGQAPQDKIVYGLDPGVGPQGSLPIPAILNSSLQSQGILFPEVKAAGTGHYSGLVTLLTGSRSVTQGLRNRPSNPTIFEYARKHANLGATDVWMIGNRIGNSLPLLNYSDHPDYGVEFGANFIAPDVTFGDEGEEHIKNAKSYHPEEDLGPVNAMQNFLNRSFNRVGSDFGGVRNTEDEKYQLRLFFEEMFAKKAANTISHPPVVSNNDMRAVGYTCEVLKWFKPKVTVVNLDSVDGCHANFTGYLRSLHRADHAVGHLWNTIQTQIPEMADNTCLIVCPEHGRNLDPNSVLDQNDWLAYDHSDLNATRIFSMVVGPGIDQNLVVGSENNPIGDISDIVLTMAEVLGIKSQVIQAGLTSSSQSLLDRI